MLLSSWMEKNYTPMLLCYIIIYFSHILSSEMVHATHFFHFVIYPQSIDVKMLECCDNYGISGNYRTAIEMSVKLSTQVLKS